MKRRWTLAAVAATAAIVLLPSTAATAHRGAPAARTPISHLVVMTQDQHSFDNYFGTRQGVDGIPSGVCVPLRSGAAKPCAQPFPLATRPELTRPAPAKDPAVAMGYYRPQDVPTLTELADSGVVFDNYFSGVPSGSIQNRLFAVTAKSTPDDNAVPESGWPNMATIFDRLETAGVPWRVYVENYEPALTIEHATSKARRGGQLARVPLLAMPRFVQSPRLMAHVVDLRQYYSDLANGTLPAVSYIVSTAATEHPPADPKLGQRLARTVVNALIASSAWPDSAFLLNYDSSGGWYDHVAPPAAADGAARGLRVPAVLISPYAQPGDVDHTLYDSASVLRFIAANWSLDPLTTRDKTAADISAALTFTQPARPAALIGVGEARPPVRQPHSAPLYAGYGFAISLTVLVFGWAVVGERRRTRMRVGAS